MFVLSKPFFTCSVIFFVNNFTFCSRFVIFFVNIFTFFSRFAVLFRRTASVFNQKFRVFRPKQTKTRKIAPLFANICLISWVLDVVVAEKAFDGARTGRGL
jgi:hypothetical protein